MNTTTDRLAQKDESFRRRMQAHAEQENPAAQQWVDYDNQAQQAGHDVKQLQQKLDQAPNDLHRAELELQDARDRRQDHMANGAPGVFEGEKRALWMGRRDNLNQEVDRGQERLAEIAQSSSPDEIQVLQDQMKQRMSEQEQALEQRRSIQLLPSERAQARQDERSNGREGQDTEQEADRMPRRLSEGLDEDWTPGQERDKPTIRTSHGRETYAATAQEEHDKFKNIERLQDEWRQDGNLGKPQPTMGELEDWEAQRQRQNQSRSR